MKCVIDIDPPELLHAKPYLVEETNYLTRQFH